jgi:hypothetical protein
MKRMYLLNKLMDMSKLSKKEIVLLVISAILLVSAAWALFTVECGNASPQNDTVVLCDSVPYIQTDSVK